MFQGTTQSWDRTIGSLRKYDDIIKVTFEIIELNHGFAIVSGEIFSDKLEENNLNPKVGDQIKIETGKVGYIIKYNDIEIGKTKIPVSGGSN